MKNNFDFEDYKILKDINTNNKLIFIMVLFLIIGMLLILKFINIRIYKDDILFKDNDSYYLYVDFNNNDYINNKKLIINNQTYDYSISDTLYETNNNLVYEKVIIKIDNYNNDELITKCSFLIEKDSLLNLFIKYIGGHHG